MQGYIWAQRRNQRANEDFDRKKADSSYVLRDEERKERTQAVTENAQSDTFNAPCCCFEYIPYTALTIV